MCSAVPTPFHKGIRMMIIALITLLVCLIILTGILWIISPGRPDPVLDENGRTVPGSLSEKVFVDINGVKQGMFIRSRDLQNPVLLYLHGGMPEYFLTRRYPTGLEDYFTVVWWEQRGSGMSCYPSVPSATVTLQQMISDTKAVTDYLRHRFGKDRIYLMGHSGGTFIAIQTAALAPEKYHAYIGVAQMSNQLESERIAHDYMLEQFRKNGNKKMARKLSAVQVSKSTGTPRSYLVLRDPAMHSLGIGTTRDMRSVITGIFLPSLTCRSYTLSEKFHLWLGKSRSGVSALWDTMLATNLGDHLTHLDIPVYFLHGIHDQTVSFTLAEDYFKKLSAPLKGFYIFGNSAHSPLFEEPEKFQQILREDILSGSSAHADFR